MVIERVEDLRRGPADYARRQIDRNANGRTVVASSSSGAGDVITPQEPSPSQSASPGQAVDPRHGVFVFPVIAGELEELVQAGKADPLHGDPGAGDPLEPELCPKNQAGQTQPADGGSEQLDVAVRRAND